MSTLTRAIVLAAQHHDGQTDKGGNPYILHPLRLMLQASTEDEQIVALLHDIVEDTPLTLDDLRNEGFEERIIEAIDCLTRRPDETYEQFIERIKGNDLARRVKILDLEDNCDLARIPYPGEKDMQRLEKYRKALSVLRDQKGE
jgi:(p)ppGpp synthase/HD superfamily hydrolase